MIAWYALFAPRGTPAPVVERLSKEIEKILQRAATSAPKWPSLAPSRIICRRKALTDYVAAESPKWGPLLKEHQGL